MPTTVTRYPTGCLGLDYQGHQFYWWCFDLKEMLAKLDTLGIKRSRVRWQEKYYHNGRYEKPSDYRTRTWNPNAIGEAPPTQDSNEETK